MFDLSWTELLVIAAIAIIVVGPKDLPRALRSVGRWTGKAKRIARDFQGQFNEALREAELDTIKKDVESVGKIDPLADMRKSVSEIKDGLKPEPVSKKPAKPAGDPELAELAADKGTDEPAPQATPATPATPPVSDSKS